MPIWVEVTCLLSSWRVPGSWPAPGPQHEVHVPSDVGTRAWPLAAPSTRVQRMAAAWGPSCHAGGFLSRVWVHAHSSSSSGETEAALCDQAAVGRNPFFLASVASGWEADSGCSSEMAEILSPQVGSRWSPSCVCMTVALGRGWTASVTPGPPEGQLQCLLTVSGVGGLW